MTKSRPPLPATTWAFSKTGNLSACRNVNIAVIIDESGPRNFSGPFLV